MRVPSRLWVYGFPLAFAGAAVLCRALLAGAPLAIHTDLAQPLAVATTWHDFGRTLWMVTFGCLVLAAVPYLAILQSALRGIGVPRLPWLVLICALALVAALCMPVIFSSDVYAYAAYGWMDAHGISPYAHAPLPLGDPLIRSAVWQWSNPLPVCVYGPFFVWIAKMCVLGAGHLGVWWELLALRAVACAGLLACGPLAFYAFAGFKYEQRIAVAAGIMLNPMAVWAAAEGHNDTLMLAVVLAGFIAIRRFGFLTGALIIASSALIKAAGVAAAMVLAMFAWSDRPRFLRVLGGMAGGILLTGIIARPFESGITTVLVPHGHYTPQFSAQFVVAQIARAILGNHAHVSEFGMALAVVAAGALALYGASRAIKGELEGAAYVALGLWLMIPNPYPWYALWLLPVAFLCLRAPVGWAIVAVSITAFARYLPDVSTATNPDINIAVTLCELALPLAILAAQARIAARSRVLESDSGA